MAIKFKHNNTYSIYFCTFTCYKWISLFEITECHDFIYKWFNYLRTQKNTEVIAFVIMPNHLHCLLYFRSTDFDLNKIISNGKRFLAYEIIRRLKIKNRSEILSQLKLDSSWRNFSKDQQHRIFEDSFDAKGIYSEQFLLQKLNYIHRNPVSGKWNLAIDFTHYPHSSASFYETGKYEYFEPFHFSEI